MPLGRRRRASSFAPATSDDAAIQRAAYAAVPYPSEPFPQTHPRSLAVEARLFGLDPAPIERCRILELGCSDGANLLAIAASLPGSEAVGVDLSAPAIEAGRRLAGQAGIGNAELRAGDFGTIDPQALGTFDYVIAHGVYSWVPARVRDQLLGLIGACLAPHGVAFVSFNLLPGGHLRRLVRDVLLVAVRDIEDPVERLAAARRELDRLASDRGRIGEVAKRLRDVRDASLFHDELAPVNDPVDLRAFAGHAGAHGLRWLTEARLGDTVFGTHPPDVRERIVGADRLAREEALDAAALRMFRQALLVRDERRVAEAPVAALAGLVVSGALRPASQRPNLDAGVVERFRHPDGGDLATDHPAVKAAFVRVAEAWPHAVAVDELGGDDAVARALLEAYAGNLVTLEAQAPPFAATPGERPCTTAFNRVRAAQGGALATLRHEALRLDDDLSRRLVALLDGSRDRAALAAALRAGGDVPTTLERDLDRVLAGLAERRVLVASAA